jgi:hypothetical protein
MNTQITDDDPAVSGSTLSQALIEPEMVHRTWYSAEYGLRADDIAGIVHFFRPNTGSWHPKFPEILKATIDARLDVSRVSADYVSDLDSFCIRVGLSDAENPWDSLEEFLDELDRRLES